MIYAIEKPDHVVRSSTGIWPVEPLSCPVEQDNKRRSLLNPLPLNPHDSSKMPTDFWQLLAWQAGTMKIWTGRCRRLFLCAALSSTRPQIKQWNMRSSLPADGGKQLAGRHFQFPQYYFEGSKKPLLIPRTIYLDIMAHDIR